MNASAPNPPLRRCPKCFTPLARSKECPALCTPVPEPLPTYSGPLVIGKTHLAKLGAPAGIEK